MPPTADAGTATEIAGSHPAVLLPDPAVPVTTAFGAPDRSPAAVPAGRLVPVAVMVPVVVMGPTAYPTSVTGMVSSGVPPPVVQLLAEAVAIQDASSRARSSVTTTEGPAVPPPRTPVMVLPGAPVPRSTVPGAVSDSAPTLTVKVTVVSGSAALGVDECASTAGPAVAADAATGVSAMPPMAATARIENADLTILVPFYKAPVAQYFIAVSVHIMTPSYRTSHSLVSCGVSNAATSSLGRGLHLTGPPAER
jgi:hypothetical protein